VSARRLVLASKHWGFMARNLKDAQSGAGSSETNDVLLDLSVFFGEF
jgi:hypothetical protein